MNPSTRHLFQIIGFVVAFPLFPVVNSFVSPPQFASSIRTEQTIFIIRKAHPVSSVLPQTRRSKRKEVEHAQQVQAANTKNGTQQTQANLWENNSIPDGVPRLSEVLKGITNEDFEGDMNPIQPSKLLADNSNQRDSNRPRQQANGARNPKGRVGVDQAPKKSSVKTHTMYNPKKMELHSRVSDTGRENRNNRDSNVTKGEHRHVTGNREQVKTGPATPWQASFRISKQTQDKIQQAGRVNGEKSVQIATSVLKTLLNTPPSQCNEANVVCALTLSAKVCEPDRRQNDEFRALLIRTLEVLHQLVKEQRLNPRQLCNAVWAIAKHYDRDPDLLPPPPETAALSSEEKLGVAEAWSLVDENDLDIVARKRIDETIDEIARQLTAILMKEDESTPTSKRTKVGELCMASWAYGILRPRRRPPGWQLPPQIGRMNSMTNGKQSMSAPSSRQSSFLTFEKWSSTEDEEEGQQNAQIVSLDVTDLLFDAIGDSLCNTTDSSQTDSNDATFDVPEKHMRLENCSWSELANVAWAYASHGHCRSQSSQQLLISLSHEAVRRLNHQHCDVEASRAFLTRDIAQIVWALGTLQCDNFRLADGLVELVETLVSFYGIREADLSISATPIRPFQNWSCPDLVQLAISLAHARLDFLPLLRVLFREAQSRLLRGLDVAPNERHQEKRDSVFRAWEVSVLLWAQARLYLTAAQGQVFEDFAAQVPRALVKAMKIYGGDLGLIGIGPQEQANVAWSLTVLQYHQSQESVEVLSSIFREAASFSQAQRMIQLEHAHQLWQALFLLEEESPMATQDVPPWFRQYLRQKWLVEKSREKRSSARHRSLSQTLHFMGVSHLNEHDEDIDVAIVLKPDASWTYQAVPLVPAASSGSRRFGGFRDVASPVKVAVEFDGPNHFAREPARPPKGITGNMGGKPPAPRALGHTVLKYRLLKKQGWTVVRVPYYEFDKIPFWASMERQRYLQRLLKTHANIRFSEVDVSQYKAMVPSRESRFD